MRQQDMDKEEHDNHTDADTGSDMDTRKHTHLTFIGLASWEK